MCGEGRIKSMGIQFGFGSGDKENAGHLQGIQLDEIDIVSIHHIDGARFRHEQIKRLDVLHLAV
jgi:hypothetical protein